MKLYEKALLFWILQIGGWGLYFAFDYFSFILPAKKGIYYFTSGTGFFIIYFSAYFTAFLLTIVLRYSYRRIDFHSTSISLALIRIIILSIAAAQVVIIISEIVKNNIVLNSPLTLEHLIKNNLEGLFRWTIPILGWSMIYCSIKILAAWKSQKLRTETISAQAENTLMETLRYQIDPDLLFASLDKIKEHSKNDIFAAKEIINDLSEYLRYILLSRKVEKVPLMTEVIAIKHYLRIETFRTCQEIDKNIKVERSIEDNLIDSLLLLQFVKLVINSLINRNLVKNRLSMEIKKQNEHVNIASVIHPLEEDQNSNMAEKIHSELHFIIDSIKDSSSDYQGISLSSTGDELRISFNID